MQMMNKIGNNMNLDIIHLILNASYAFDSKYGHGPNCIYVGRKELAQIKMQSRDYQWSPADAELSTCCGLVVIEVKEGSHFNVAATNHQ